MTYDYDITQVQDMINSHIGLISVDAGSLSDAKERSGKFLILSAILVSSLKDLEITIAKAQTLVDVTYSQAMRAAEGKNATEKSANSDADPQYSSSRELYETLEAKRSYLRNFIKVFENAHVLYRQYSKES